MKSSMKTKRRNELARMLCSWLMIISTSVGCCYAFSGKPGTHIPTIKVNLSAKGGAIGITSWRITGPFVPTMGDHLATSVKLTELLATDYLKLAGTQESPLYLPVKTTNTKLNLDRDPYGELKAPSSPNVFLNQNVEFPTPVVSTQFLYWGAYHVFKVIYATTNLVSSVDQDVILLTMADSPIKLWINDEIQVQSGKHGTENLNFAVKIHLRAGTNKLLVKEACYPLRNEFAMWLMTPARARQTIQMHNEKFQVASELVIRPGSSLSINQSMVSILGGSSGSDVRYELHDISGNIVKEGQVSLTSRNIIKLSGLPDGIYSINLIKGEFSAGDLFFLGHIQRRFTKYYALCSVQHSDSLPCDALDHSGGRPHHTGQRKTVFVIAQFEYAIHNIPLDKHFNDYAFRIRLVSFRSPTNKTIRSYFLYVPKNTSPDEHIPLVVTLKPLPTNDSDFYIPIDSLNIYARVADKYHVGYLVPLEHSEHDLLTDSYSNYILEILHDIGLRLKIDNSRIYLAGSCDAGRNALLIAENYPDTYAAVSVLQPMVGKLSPQARMRVNGYYFNVYSKLSNLSSIPVRFVHCRRDFHSPLSQDVFFGQQAKSVGLNPELKVLPCDDTGRFDLVDPNDSVFEFFSKVHGRRPNPSRTK